LAPDTFAPKVAMRLRATKILIGFIYILREIKRWDLI
jgi:hypothetical protein